MIDFYIKRTDEKVSFASRPATTSAKMPDSRAEERFEDAGYEVG